MLKFLRMQVSIVWTTFVSICFIPFLIGRTSYMQWASSTPNCQPHWYSLPDNVNQKSSTGLANEIYGGLRFLSWRAHQAPSTIQAKLVHSNLSDLAKNINLSSSWYGSVNLISFDKHLETKMSFIIAGSCVFPIKCCNIPCTDISIQIRMFAKVDC